MKSTTTIRILLAAFFALAALSFFGQSGYAEEEKPYGISDYVPFMTSRVAGSPEPPLPYRVVRTLPKLEVEWPIFVTTEPGSSRLIFIHDHRTEKKFRVCRSKDDRSTGEFDVLFEQNDPA